MMSIRHKTTKLRNAATKALACLVMMAMVGLYPAMAAAADTSAPTTDTTTPTTQSTTTPTDSNSNSTATAPSANQTQDSSTANTSTTTPATPGPQGKVGADSSKTGPQGKVGVDSSKTGPQGSVGPQKPTGADASTYTFNKDTGLWENDHYTWNPTTGQAAPKDHPNYSYDPKTQTWSTDTYVYDAASGKYVPTPQPVNPLVAQLLGLMPPAGSQTSGPLAAANANSGGTSGSTGFFDLFNNVTIQNAINSLAVTGDASVSNNTAAGSALTGNAAVLSNVINAFNALWSLTGGNVVTYLKNIFGDVTGDLTLDPNALSATNSANGSSNGSIGTTGPNSSNTITDQNGVTTTVNARNNGQIDNNINLAAQSGNANVSGNTSAQNATSGMASVVLNLVNILNSAISSGQSFFGMINIFGNFNGDVLFPPGFLDSLLSLGSSAPTTTNAQISTTGPNSANGINQNNSTQTNITNASTTGIANNIASNAQSGAANVNDNTQAGSASTGAANSNVTLFNLTGQNVVGSNAFLVVVNVLGHWLGFIMDAPQGSHAALLGGGASTSSAINTTGPNSANNITGNNSTSTNLNTSSNNAINNNVNLAAQSGDANVSHNTLGGNATSGAANIAANVVNISMSDLALTNWFGMLFINVFGNWTGAVGVNTAAGTVGGSGNGSAPVSFTPGGVAAVNKTHLASVSSIGSSAQTADNHASSVSGSTTPGNGGGNSSAINTSPANAFHSLASKPFFKTLQFSLICVAVAALMLVGDQVITRRRRRKRLPMAAINLLP